MDHLDRLLLFRDIVELGNLTQAAAKWKVTHSTVSKHLKALEQSLDLRLLHRTSRALRLTEEGKLVYKYALQLSQTHEELMDALDSRREEVRGHIKITSFVHIGRYLAKELFQPFSQRYPDVKFTWMLQDATLDMIRDGFDLAIRVGRLKDSSLIMRKLCRHPVCLAASPSFIQRYGNPERPKDIEDIPTVTYASKVTEVENWPYLKEGQQQTIQVRPILRVNDGNALLEVVKSGMGIGYLSMFAAQPAFQKGTLVPILPKLQLPDFAPIFVCYPGKQHIPLRVKVFLQMLEDCLKYSKLVSTQDMAQEGNAQAEASNKVETT